MLAGVIPLLLGLLFDLVIVAPLRVPPDQTPLFYPWQVEKHGTFMVGSDYVTFFLAFQFTSLCPIQTLSHHTPVSVEI